MISACPSPFANVIRTGSGRRVLLTQRQAQGYLTIEITPDQARSTAQTLLAAADLADARTTTEQLDRPSPDLSCAGATVQSEPPPVAAASVSPTLEQIVDLFAEGLRIILEDGLGRPPMQPSAIGGPDWRLAKKLGLQQRCLREPPTPSVMGKAV